MFVLINLDFVVAVCLATVPGLIRADGAAPGLSWPTEVGRFNIEVTGWCCVLMVDGAVLTVS